MDFISIDNKIYDIQQRVYHYSDLNTAERAIAPIVWYVYTNRAPSDFLRDLCATNNKQVTTIAKRLLKYAGGSYDDAIDSIRSYLISLHNGGTNTLDLP